MSIDVVNITIKCTHSKSHSLALYACQTLKTLFCNSTLDVSRAASFSARVENGQLTTFRVDADDEIMFCAPLVDSNQIKLGMVIDPTRSEWDSQFAPMLSSTTSMQVDRFCVPAAIKAISYAQCSRWIVLVIKRCQRMTIVTQD